MDQHSLELLEYDRVAAAVAARAESASARRALAAWVPIASPQARAAEFHALREAIARQAAPGARCQVAPGDLGERLDPESTEPLDGPGLVEVGLWLAAGRETRQAWSDEIARGEWPALASLADRLPDLRALEERLTRSLDPDGRVRDSASPALARARRDLERGERDLERRLERWGREFGESSYVTRHADRFVVLVPAAGFPRRRALVHDVSGSGQSRFVEPLEACEGNNHLIELRSAALEEERRLLRELAEAVRGAGDALAELEAVLIGFDTLRARARWAGEFAGVAILPGGGRLRLVAARHPLLAMARPGEVVPLDMTLEGEDRLLLVSGPNMGGKTVLLKTVGLVAALAHAALPVPAGEGSEVPELDEILADLGDAQSVDRGLSTFAAHLGALAAMAEAAGPRTLVLSDELGAGTDPEEGAALGRALIERFASRGAWGVLTTHLGGLKRVAGEVRGVVNGSLEFDPERMTSLFRFIAGVPGASHALAVAERLGLPADVLARARALTPAEAQALERLLLELQATRRSWEAEQAALREARAAAEAEAARHHEATQDSRRTLEELRRKLTRESEAILAQARELWQTVQRESRRAEKTRAGAEELRSRLGTVERRVEELHQAAREAGGEPAPEPLRERDLVAGARVRIVDLGVEAEIVSPPDAEGRVVLRRGGWSIQSHVDRLAPLEADAARATHDADVRPRASFEPAGEEPGLEVNLLGLDAEEALRALDAGLDRAVVTGLSELRIVHGIGRGVLRAAVERHLRGHPQVASSHLGAVGEGGRGVTIARLR